MIKFSDFQKLEIRLGKVSSVEKIEGADKLYKLEVDFGQEKRQVIAGIADQISLEELESQLFPFVVNLEPVQIRGLMSQAMILVAEDENKNLALIKPTKVLKPGSKIV